MVTSRSFAAAALLAAACGSDPTAAVTIPATLPPAADPRLPSFPGWPLAFAVDNDGFDALECRIALARDGAPVRTLVAPVDLEAGTCAATWDVRDGDGALLAPGVVSLTVDVGPPAEDGAEPSIAATASTTVEVVRVGVTEIHLGGAGRVDLLYGAMGGVEGGYFPIPPERAGWRIESLDLVDGTPRALPAPWDDLRSPPLDAASGDGTEQTTFNLPAAFVAGSQPDFAATLDAGGYGAPAVVELRVAAPAGAAIPGDAAFAPGAVVTARATASPAPAVGRYEVALDWRFEARVAGGEWIAVPGSFSTAHRLYGLAGEPSFQHASVPHAPWVEIVDVVAGWVDGQTADPVAVAGRIVEGVYFELGLVYDRESGASAYTDYPGFGWEGSTFALSAFLVRGDGNIINCSDAASIVSTYATMIGVDFRYHILQRPDDAGFDLNYIKAIGWDEFDETPFFGDRGRFRYHAVVGPADGSFYDATLALDGDGTPTAPPHVDLLARGMPPADYLLALSSEWNLIDTLVDEQVEIR